MRETSEEHLQSSLTFHKDNFHYPESTYCLRTHICNWELLRTLPVATKYLLCLKALQVISVIVSHLLFLAFCLSFSLFISLFLFFLGVQKACWDCRSMSAEAVMKGDQSTGKITVDKRVLMKGSGLGAHCLWCRVLSEFFLWVYRRAGEWKLQEEVSRFRRNACAKKWNQFIYNALTLIHRNEEKGGSGTSCCL